MLNKIKLSFYACCFAFLLLCILQSNAYSQSNVIELDYNFRANLQGWSGGFADYSTLNDPKILNFDKRLRYIPRKATRVPIRGFMIQGRNISDDLFMFLKRRLTSKDGIVAGQTYRLHFTVEFASNAAEGCAGIGGSPGNDVYLKTGAAPIEPIPTLQSDGTSIRLNVDIGNQNNSGPAASIAGDISNGIPCENALPVFPYVITQRSHTHIVNVTANNAGELWLLIGTDSGFEGLTRLYYKRIQVTLTPV